MKRLPTKKDYDLFLERMKEGLERESPGSCFYVYGSVVEGLCNPGRSDIDGGIILNSEPITPKKEVLKIAELYAKARRGINIETQFHLLDRITCKDGRFLSYTKDFTDHIKKNGRIICGPDYLSEMKGKDYKSGVLYSSAFNFSGPGGVRGAVLYSSFLLETDLKKFQNRIGNAIEKFAKFPKKLLWLVGEEIIPSRHISKQRLEKILTGIDFDTLDEINDLLDRPEKFYEALSNVPRAKRLLIKTLKVMEQMVNSYLQHYPQHSMREYAL